MQQINIQHSLKLIKFCIISILVLCFVMKLNLELSYFTEIGISTGLLLICVFEREWLIVAGKCCEP